MRPAILKQFSNLPKTVFRTQFCKHRLPTAVSGHLRPGHERCGETIRRFSNLPFIKQSSLRCQHTKVNNDYFTVSNDQSPSSMPRRHVDSYYDRYVFPEPPELISNDEHEAVISKVNESLKDPGRLFAVVLFKGQQFKITTHDLVRVNSYILADCGQKIRLEKVMLVGGEDFTLLGRPFLKRNLVEITATVIEKTPGVDVILKRFKRRKRFERTYKLTSLHSTLRINSINVISSLE